METKEKVKYIFDVLQAAEVYIVDFAALTGISRETLHRWKKGGPITDKLRLNIAYGTAVRLNTAVESGKLPFTERYKNPQRKAVLRKVVSSPR